MFPFDPFSSWKNQKNFGFVMVLEGGQKGKWLLTLPTPRISESCIKIKINFNVYFHTPFEAPQRSVKIKIKLKLTFFVRNRNVKG